MSYQKMSVRDLVLEIGTEEIPSGYFDHIHDILSSKSDSPIDGLFTSKNISVGSINSYSTPRRIILHIEDIPISQDIKLMGHLCMLPMMKIKAQQSTTSLFKKVCMQNFPVLITQRMKEYQ